MESPTRLMQKMDAKSDSHFCVWWVGLGVMDEEDFSPFYCHHGSGLV